MLRPSVFDRLARQCRQDGGDENGLGHHHRSRGEQQPQAAERTCARQQQIDDEPDHDRRQPHRRIENHDDGLAAGKTGKRQGRTERQADRSRDQRGGETYLQRQRHDPVQLPVAAEQQGQCRRKCIAKYRHGCGGMSVGRAGRSNPPCSRVCKFLQDFA
jgi:hypothetical protein